MSHEFCTDPECHCIEVARLLDRVAVAEYEAARAENELKLLTSILVSRRRRTPAQQRRAKKGKKP